jgi:hypothetical protein
VNDEPDYIIVIHLAKMRGAVRQWSDEGSGVMEHLTHLERPEVVGEIRSSRSLFFASCSDLYHRGPKYGENE